MTRVLRIATIALAAVALAAGCSSSSKSGVKQSSTTTVPVANPVYAKAGPWAVGYTKLRLPDRDVYVWYPVDPSTVGGKAKATYDQRTPLPANLQALVPDKYNAVTTMNAYSDLPGSTYGPFPVVLFSHGYGGYPLVNAANSTGIASWGFVVVSVDYFERGLANQVLNKKYPNDPTRDPKLLMSSLDLVEKASGDTSSVLHGTVDATKVGAVGHSAGGNTVFDALAEDPRVAVAIGYAPVGPDVAPANKPTMIIAGSLDNALTPAKLQETYAKFPAPKARIEVANAGHNTFTDVCPVIRGGGGLIQYAVTNHLITDQLASLALNGCAQTDLDPAVFLPIVQHFTVAELRWALKVDPQPVGLGDGIATAFPGATIHYEHQP